MYVYIYIASKLLFKLLIFIIRLLVALKATIFNSLATFLNLINVAIVSLEVYVCLYEIRESTWQSFFRSAHFNLAHLFNYLFIYYFNWIPAHLEEDQKANQGIPCKFL